MKAATKTNPIHPAGATAGHNSQARGEIIRKVGNEIDGLESQVAAIQAEIRTIKQKRVKGDLKMKIIDFNIARRMLSLEGADRDELLGTVREVFDAMGIGDQLDWVEAQDRLEAKAEPPSEQDKLDESKAAGKGPVGKPQAKKKAA